MKVIIGLRRQSLCAGDHGFKKGNRVAKDEGYTGSVIKAGAKLAKADFDDVLGSLPVLVHITFSNLDNNKYLTDELLDGLRNGLKNQMRRFVRGPLWS